jgi:hypothetical protein
VISKTDLRKELRKDLEGRGLKRVSGEPLQGDGPLPRSFPNVMGGWYWVPTLYRAGLIVAEAQKLIDTITRVPGIFDCKEFGRVAHALALMYLVQRKPGKRMRYEWLFNEDGAARPAVGFVASGHAQALIYTTSGTRFWEPQFDGGALLEPQPYEIRPGHWGIHYGSF